MSRHRWYSQYPLFRPCVIDEEASLLPSASMGGEIFQLLDPYAAVDRSNVDDLLKEQRTSMEVTFDTMNWSRPDA